MCKVWKKTVNSWWSYKRLKLLHLNSNVKYVINVLYPMSGCNRNGKVVGGFREFPDFNSEPIFTKIESVLPITHIYPQE